MSQNNPSATNISSPSEEVDPSTRMISMMDRLIQQQERIISLIEAIAAKTEDHDNSAIIDDHERRDRISVPVEEQLPEHVRLRRLKLYRAALNGDWEAAKRIYDVYEDDIHVEISEGRETALHIATGAKHTNFVKELVNKMNKEDLEKGNNFGRTALFIAVSSGMAEIADVMIKKNKAIAMVGDMYGTLPIYKAALLGHKDMVQYLYQETKNDLMEDHRKELFVISIETDLYDFSLQLLKDYSDLDIARSRARAEYDDKTGVTALHVLARKRPTFSNQSQRGMFERCFNHGAKDVENKKWQALELVKLIWKRVVSLSHIEISELITEPRNLIFDGAKRGNVEFLSILIREYPDLIGKLDDNNYSIFHYAVKNRQKDVFKLIHEIGATKDLILEFVDEDGNNILHLAGMMAPPDVPNIVPGPALQMQSELLWFKEVENVVQPRSSEARNMYGLTPRELFAEEHKDLRDKGEKWMKQIPGSCIVVATLITGVAFAAAFTAPGGNNGDTGFPIFLENVSFKIFAISDAISMVFSSASILNFLSIFASSCEQEEFLWWLPRRLHLGLATLSISIAATMVVFSTTFFIFFNDTRLWIAILVTAIASPSIIMLILQHLKLSYDVLRPTHISCLLFQQGKSNLFQEEKEGSDQCQYAHLKSQYPCSTNV